MSRENLETTVMVVAAGLIALGLVQAALVTYMYVRSKKVREEAGALLVPRVSLFAKPRTPPKWALVFGGVPLLSSFAFLLMQSSISIVLIAGCAVIFLPVLFWRSVATGPGSLELREQGIVHAGIEVIPWSSVHRYRLQEGEPARLKLYTSNSIVELPLSHEEQGAVDGVLAEHLVRVEGEDAASAEFSHLPSAPQSG